MSLPPAGWPNCMNSESVRLGGIDWHVQIAGDGPVLLLLHGTGAATHSWRDMLHPLAQHFRVIAPDLPGHGFTKGRPPNGLTMPGIARAIAYLLSELQADPVLVVGHSAGAAVAIRMVINRMVQPAGIVGVAPALLPFPGIAQHLFPTMAKLLFVNPLAPHLFASVARGPGAVERFLARSTGSTIDAAGIAAYARLFGTSAHCAGAIGMMADWDLLPLKRDLPLLSGPMLMLHGDGDVAIPVAAARESAGLIPDCTLEILPGLGHLAHEEAPALAVGHILQFARTHAILAAEGKAA